MSDQIPMPKVIGEPPPARDYAPKQRGLEAVADALAQQPPRSYAYSPPQPGSQHTAAIKDSLKKLTHREMRELVAAIFAALGNEMAHAEAIPRGDMADVLDRVAHGD